MSSHQWRGQSLGLNPIEMIWHDIKQAINAEKPSD